MVTNITINTEIDIDDVFATLSREQKSEFINHFIEYASTTALLRAFISRCANDKIADGSISGTQAHEILAKIDHADKYQYMRNQGYELTEPQ